MSTQTPGRVARSVCIVTDAPIALQYKITIFTSAAVRVRVSLSATGELVIEIEPP